ncbi:MAG: DUF2400 family protein [Bacteroidaceae bacterium]|nr:DUF2400 family protein [Bacteroidaceae bacterium]
MIDIKGLANYGENMTCFADSFIKVLHEYDGTAKDKEMLALFACCLMTSDAKSDKKDIEKLLAIIQEQTPSVWDYIDRELFMVDFHMRPVRTLSFADDMQVFKVFVILHGIILTTQTVERSLKISYNYNGNYEDFFIRLFRNAGVKDIFSNDPSDSQERIWTFLRLMVRKSPVDLGSWDWIPPSILQVPINEDLVWSANKIGLIKGGANTAQTRAVITDAFREHFPEDPAKGYFALHAYLSEMS